MNANFNSIRELSDFLLTIDDVLIVTHERPDGDAIGSAFAMQRALLNNGKNAFIYFNETLPIRYSNYINDKTFIVDITRDKAYKYCIALDCGNYDRLAIFDKDLKDKLTLINIDHHPDNELFGAYNFVRPDACSTAEIIFDIISANKSWLIDKEFASYALTGIMLDTGGLRFANANSGVLRKTAELIDFGADYHKIIKEMYFSTPLQKLLMESDLFLNYRKSAFDSKFLFIHMSSEIMNRYAIQYKEAEGIIDNLRTVNGVIIAATIARLNDGYKISLRSNDSSYPVNLLAKELSGGGHKLAAGCHIKTDSYEEAESILLSKVKTLLEG